MKLNFSGNRFLPITLVFILGSLWGLHFSLIKICSESGISHFSILIATTGGVALIFSVITLLQRQLPKVSLTHLRFYLICAVLGYAGPILIELVVAQHMDAGLLTLIVSTTPLVTLSIATIIKTEKVKARGLIGVGLGCLTIFVLLIPKFSGANAVPWQYLIITFTVPIAYGTYHNYVSKAWPADSSTWQVASGELIVALLLLLPFYFFQSGSLFPQAQWQTVHWAMLLMVVFAVVEVYLYFEIIRLAGAVTVSLSNFVTIAAGVIWGMLIFKERPEWWEWACVAVLMVALYLVLGNRKLQTT